MYSMSQYASNYHRGLISEIRTSDRLLVFPEVAYAMGLKLTPLNRDRTHIAQFLVQAALEMAHHTDSVYGVDPLREQAKQNKWMVLVWVLVYKAKIALTSFALKIALKRLVSRDVAKYAGESHTHSAVPVL